MDQASILAVFLTCTLLALAPGAAMADAPIYQLRIKNHRFQPPKLHLPAGKRIRLVVHNEDSTPEEFESYDLNREKLIPAGSKGHVYIGPLTPGRYPFFGDFHQKTARGVVIAK